MLRNLYAFFFLIFISINYAQTFDLGEINGADYFIYIPENWNKGLVMYAHGYEEIGEETEPFVQEVGEFKDIFISRGFAFAASKYKRQGLILKDGIEDTEALRSYFELKYGKPNLCIITGHSMGGMISLATIERYQNEYDGALPLCGWLEPAHSLMKFSLDLLATYDYLFGPNDGEIVSGNEKVTMEEIEKRINAKPDLADKFARQFEFRFEDIAWVVDFFQHVFKESSSWLGGLPAGNKKTIYSGFLYNDDTMNENVRRYQADHEAEEYFIQYHTPTGIISDPVIALHTTYDEILPVFSYKFYEEMTERVGTDNLYTQKFVVRDGHCNFTLEEISDAFDELLLMIDEKNKK